MEAAEDASPDSIRVVVSLLHKSLSDEYTESEKVLLTLCAEIMRLCWPSENVTWEVPEVSRANPYLGAVDSALRGVYDSSTGNSDFLTLILPSLVLVTSSSRTDYFSEAERSLTTALGQRPASTLANYLMGLLKMKQGAFMQAVPFFSSATTTAPDVIELRLATAEAYFAAKNYSQSLELSKAILEKYPQNVRALELCAESSYSMNNIDEAESYIMRVLLLEPENLKFVLFRANILINRGDYIRASSLMDMYARSDTTSRDYLLLRARMQRDWNKNSTAAGETIGTALTLYPDDEDILLFAAEIASSANIQVAGMKAEEIVSRILEKNPSNEKAMQISIGENIRNHSWQEAYTLSSRLLSYHQNIFTLSSDSLLNHVDICLALGKSDEALNIATRMYEQHPEEEGPVQAYIKTLVKTNQRSLASQHIARLLPSANQRMKSFLYYQRSLLAPNDDSALSDLRSSLTSNPRNSDALYRLYEIYYAKNDWRRAQYYLKQVVALDPTNQDLLQKNAKLDSLLGK